MVAGRQTHLLSGDTEVNQAASALLEFTAPFRRKPDSVHGLFCTYSAEMYLAVSLGQFQFGFAQDTLRPQFKLMQSNRW